MSNVADVPSTDKFGHVGVVVDVSGSMGGTRIEQAKRLLKCVEERCENLHIQTFNTSAQPCASIDDLKISGGTALAAAALAVKGLLKEEGMQGDAPLFILTDSESVFDHKDAADIVEPLTELLGQRRCVLVGFGKDHVIHDLMALWPCDMVLQCLYRNIPSDFGAVPAVRTVFGVPAATSLHLAPGAFEPVVAEMLDTDKWAVGGAVIYLPRGQELLVPMGVPLEAVVLNGSETAAVAPIVVELCDSVAEVQAALNVIGAAAAAVIGRLYNGVHAALRKAGAETAKVEVLVRAMRDMSTAELQYQRRVLAMATHSVADATAAWTEARTCFAGGRKGVSEAARAALRASLVPQAALKSLLEDINALVHEPLQEENRQKAAQLLDALSRGDQSASARARMEAVIAGRVRSDDYRKLMEALAAVGGGGGGGGPAGAGGPAVISAIDEAGRRVMQSPDCEDLRTCFITTDDGPVLVVLGSIQRSANAAVGAIMNPLLVDPKTVDGCAVCVGPALHMLKMSLKHTVRAQSGDVNAVVGFLPGGGPLANKAFALVVADMSTGDTATPISGLRAVWSALAGVVALLEELPLRGSLATALVLGWAAVAAREKARMLLPDGNVDEHGVTDSALVQCWRLLANACRNPQAYVGRQIAKSKWWRALVFAQQTFAAHCLEQWEAMPADAKFTAEGLAQLEDALHVADVADAAQWFLHPVGDLPGKVMSRLCARLSNPCALPAGVEGCDVKASAWASVVDEVLLPSTVAEDYAVRQLHERFLPADYTASDRAVFWEVVRSGGKLSAKTFQVAKDCGVLYALLAADAVALNKAQEGVVAKMKQGAQGKAWEYCVCSTGIAVVVEKTPGATVLTVLHCDGVQRDHCIRQPAGLPRTRSGFLDSLSFLDGPIPHDMAKWWIEGFHEHMAQGLPVHAPAKYVQQWGALRAVQRYVWSLSDGDLKAATAESVYDAVPALSPATKYVAAPWGPEDAPLVAEAYPPGVVQWSYELASVHVLLVVARTRSLTSAVDLKELRSVLGRHRAHVVPFATFESACSTRGVAGDIRQLYGECARAYIAQRHAYVR